MRRLLSALSRKRKGARPLRWGLVVLGVFAVAVLLSVGGRLWQALCLLTYEPHYEGPFGVMVTLDGDPAHEVTIHYQTLAQDGIVVPDSEDKAFCHYDVCSHDGDPNAYAYHGEGRSGSIAGLSDGRHVHRVVLDGLKPGCVYYFVVGDEDSGYSPERKFRTLPGEDAPLRFVVGGDMGGYPPDEYPNTLPLLREAARRDPQFAVVGGDIAYASGDLRRVKRWDKWFERWSETMVTSDGCTIPVIAAMGNHEANDESIETAAIRAPFYVAFFGSEPPYSYFTVDLADYARLFVLDSGYLAPSSGAQSAWLAGELKAASGVPVKMAVYHVPMYPGYGDFDGDHSTWEREAWLPLFDQYGLTVAFENHDHVFKRSHRLRSNQIDPSGTLYLGDGCFGVRPRAMRGPDRWYLEKRASQGHFWLVDVDKKNGIEFQAIAPDGSVFDRCSLPPVAPQTLGALPQDPAAEGSAAVIPR